MITVSVLKKFPFTEDQIRKEKNFVFEGEEAVLEEGGGMKFISFYHKGLPFMIAMVPFLDEFDAVKWDIQIPREIFDRFLSSFEFIR